MKTDFDKLRTRTIIVQFISSIVLIAGIMLTSLVSIHFLFIPILAAWAEGYAVAYYSNIEHLERLAKFIGDRIMILDDSSDELTPLNKFDEEDKSKSSID